MSIEDATVIVLVYVLASMGVIIAFLLAVSLIGRFIGRLRQRRREQSGEEYAMRLGTCFLDGTGSGPRTPAGL